MENIDTMIKLAKFANRIGEKTINLLMPSSGIFIQTVQGFFSQQTSLECVTKESSFFHIDVFTQITMNKGTLYIPLMHFPTKTSNKGKYKSNKVHLCNRGKRSFVVYAFVLRVTLGYQTSFVAFNSTS